LKTDIELITKLDNGLNLYKWRWNEIALEHFGKTGYSQGVIAQEVQKVFPEAVSESHGFFQVDYNMIFNK